MPRIFEAPPGFVLNPDYLVPELRAQRDALLEALKMAQFQIENQCDVGVDEWIACSKKVRAALAQQAEPVACTWQQDGDSDSGVYGTSCGGYFNIEDGTPEDNRMAWCCYCGKKLAQELITENEDE